MTGFDPVQECRFMSAGSGRTPSPDLERLQCGDAIDREPAPPVAETLFGRPGGRVPLPRIVAAEQRHRVVCLEECAVGVKVVGPLLVEWAFRVAGHEVESIPLVGAVTRVQREPALVPQPVDEVLLYRVDLIAGAAVVLSRAPSVLIDEVLDIVEISNPTGDAVAGWHAVAGPRVFGEVGVEIPQ